MPTPNNFHVVLVYTVSKHATARGAQIACRKLQGSEDDIAMVVEMPSTPLPLPDVDQTPLRLAKRLSDDRLHGKEKRNDTTTKHKRAIPRKRAKGAR